MDFQGMSQPFLRKKLREIRKDKALSLTVLAQNIGISRTTLEIFLYDEQHVISDVTEYKIQNYIEDLSLKEKNGLK